MQNLGIIIFRCSNKHKTLSYNGFYDFSPHFYPLDDREKTQINKIVTTTNKNNLICHFRHTRLLSKLPHIVLHLFL